MAKKRKPTAKKATKPTARRVPKARAKAARAKRSGSSSKSGSNSRGGKVALFEEAKSATIDSLIRVIEEAERRLTAAKRAGSFEELAPCQGGGKLG